MSVVGTRSWAGSTLADRQAERRTKLLDAAVSLLASGGGPAVTVRAVCRTSGVTERYFYENFSDRDHLVLAAFDRLSDTVEAAIVAAVSGRPVREVATAAVDAVVGVTLDQPDVGRALFIAPMTEPVLYQRIERTGIMLGALIRTQLPPDAPGAHRDLVASGLAGALAHLFHQYVAGTLEVSRAEFVSHCVQLLQTMAAMPAPGASAGASASRSDSRP